MNYTVQKSLFDDLESVSKKHHRIVSRSKTVVTKIVPDELYVDDAPVEEVTIPCDECGKQAHIEIHGKKFCMEHYERYFYRTDSVVLGEFKFISGR